MCRVVIRRWGGRFGNNIMQIAHACEFAFRKNSCHSISFPNHPNLTSTTIQNNSNTTTCQCENTLYSPSNENEFFYLNSNWVKRREMIQTYILPIIDKRITNNNETKLFDCCVHIRSGDVKSATSGNYAKLALGYYTTIIDSMLTRSNKVHIIFEDSFIDVFKPLTDRYASTKNVSYTSRTSLEEALNTLMRCNVLVTSVGTFSMTAMCMSKTIRTLYAPIARQSSSQYIETEDQEVSYVFV